MGQVLKFFGGSPYKITKNLKNPLTFLKIIIISTTTCIHSLFNRRGVPFNVAEQAYKVCFSIILMINLYSRCFYFFPCPVQNVLFKILDNFCNSQNWQHPFRYDVL